MNAGKNSRKAQVRQDGGSKKRPKHGVGAMLVRTQGELLDTRYGALLEIVPDAIVVVNNTGRIVLINGQTESLFGYRRDELLGKSIEVLLPEFFQHTNSGHQRGYFSEPKTRIMGAGVELFARNKDGSEFPVAISLSPLHTDMGMFTMSAVRNLTDRKKLEEELRKKNDELEQQNRLLQRVDRLKSEFLANMSHELRTPLNGIIGFAEIMHDEKVGPVSSDHKEYLHDILSSGRHLLQLINDILDLSKAEAGKLDFFPERINPAILLAEVCEIVRTRAAKKRIKIETECDAELAVIHADGRRLKQILYNYLSNALKFTPHEGKVTVRVKSEGGDHFRIEVEDTGIGIRPEDLHRLFLEFQQLDRGAARPYGGTGLGLALTKSIVDAQGGRVGVTSTPGRGSTFYARLPRALTLLPPRAAAETTDPQIVAPTPGAPLILVVEDDADDRAWIAATLRSSGYAVETVATGAEALVRCREQKFTAITLDIMLPDMSGRAVLEKLRERGPNQHTPVTIVTLLADKGIVSGLQVNDILSKPASQSELIKALERCAVMPSTPRPILVIDDDRSALKLAREMLGHLGYRTVCRKNGNSALRAAAKERPAAIVLDLVMPTMNGFEFLKRFRRANRGRYTPVIVWTSKDLTSLEKSELRSAATAVAKKDRNARELITEIQSILRVPEAPAHETYER